MKQDSEILHWADQAARKVVGEHGDKDKYTVAAGITPSGTIHMGNFREIITQELVKRGLESLGKKVRFIYSWDDFDVFRKVPKNMPKKELLKSLLRKPITTVPDTFGCNHDNYARHNEIELEKDLPAVGISPEFIKQSKMYGECKYAKGIKKALESKDKIKAVLDKTRKEPLGKDWLPVSVFCEKCGKDTVSKIEYKGDFSLYYECECGHKDTFDFRKKGIAKLGWRTDWAMRWDFEKVNFESAGKDHFAAGGSFFSSKEICKKVYDYDGPSGIRYEWISIKGQGQFASSSGLVITLKEMLEVYEPNIIRWFFASTRPTAEFDISFDLDVLKYYEDFDRCERIYFKKEEVDEKELGKQKRIYELSSVELPKKIPFQPGFRHLTTVLQVYEKDVKKAAEFFKEDLKTKEDKERFEVRCNCVLNWLEKYAPEEFKFSVQEKVNVKLDDKQKEALHKAAEVLKKSVKDDKELHEKFYNICQELEMKPGEFFKAAYLVLLNKERGPRLASFILTVGKKKVAELFGKV
ncbi:MAG: lysine--tRNA ligase [Candidatus Woesearchaeota archaeon]|jgi:lysyl-tRNA synthetase class 1|nr:lysine--tRNA ligase [Candidatus Woesearchaeota archaeon]MDP7610504.1 lysine--tRNA ligase [Candidatus Woesearchaeota archaeon]|tara:strand:- start:1310 stop:2878 length:1569 start_codon:yes stop_codon:yes gene_type:complete